MIVQILLNSADASAEGRKFISFYAGRFSNTTFVDILQFKTSFENSNVYVLALGKELTDYRNSVGIEVEGQIATHSGSQDHEEINALLTLRWLRFPWDPYIDTSFGFGNGVSYATEDPPLEIREADDHRTAQWLYYMMVEWAFSLPDLPQWSPFIRVHHRSSVFGAVDGLFSGSNFVGLGIRRYF
jgi:hypothetical protein